MCIFAADNVVGVIIFFIIKLNTNMPLFNDHFQNYKQYNIPKAQLIIADIL